ncbi:uncharacterized protein LOC114881191 [Osmia bicornis bicornis]|uniref:uncharacterized protein LOC114881191 n=1 Tax=Osmia bicornis bicornis TaxID=1437191 RepID=UPI001EAF719D|nr:uncharacterized protein LOC114881191 [Osmia bicornis bicornis]
MTDFDYSSTLIDSKVRKDDTYMRPAITQAISAIVPEVCDGIIEVLQEYVKAPSTEEEWLTVAKEFKDKWNFPHFIGAVDGKHVMIQAPWNSGTEYHNYKNFFSIVLFALVDADYNFMYVDVGCQGRISDGGVFKNTNLYKKLENNTSNIPTPSALLVSYSLKIPYMILGDKAFALNQYTMRPFEGNPERGSIERIFNYRHSRARKVVGLYQKVGRKFGCVIYHWKALNERNTMVWVGGLKYVILT